MNERMPKQAGELSVLNVGDSAMAKALNGRELLTLAPSHGFVVREEWLGDYYDGLTATRKVGPHRVEVYTGGADDGAYSEPHYGAVVYVDGKRVASGLTVPKALRVAQFRCLTLNGTHGVDLPDGAQR